MMDIFLCEVCMGYMGDEGRWPRVLCCGHSFCSLCTFNLLKDGKLVCPICCAESHFRTSHEIPLNHTLIRILSSSLARNAQQAGSSANQGTSWSKNYPDHHSDNSLKSLHVNANSLSDGLSISQEPHVTAEEPSHHAGVCLKHKQYCVFWCLRCLEWICCDCRVIDHPQNECQITSICQALRDMQQKEDQNIKDTIVLFDKNLLSYRLKHQSIRELRQRHRMQIQELHRILSKHQRAERALEKDDSLLQSTVCDGLGICFMLLESQSHLLKAQSLEEMLASRRSAQECQSAILSWYEPSYLCDSEEVLYSKELQKATITALAIMKESMEASQNTIIRAEANTFTTISAETKEELVQILSRILGSGNEKLSHFNESNADHSHNVEERNSANISRGKENIKTTGNSSNSERLPESELSTGKKDTRWSDHNKSDMRPKKGIDMEKRPTGCYLTSFGDNCEDVSDVKVSVDKKEMKEKKQIDEKIIANVSAENNPSGAEPLIQNKISLNECKTIGCSKDERSRFSLHTEETCKDSKSTSLVDTVLISTEAACPDIRNSGTVAKNIKKSKSASVGISGTNVSGLSVMDKDIAKTYARLTDVTNENVMGTDVAGADVADTDAVGGYEADTNEAITDVASTNAKDSDQAFTGVAGKDVAAIYIPGNDRPCKNAAHTDVTSTYLAKTSVSSENVSSTEVGSFDGTETNMLETDVGIETIDVENKNLSERNMNNKDRESNISVEDWVAKKRMSIDGYAKDTRNITNDNVTGLKREDYRSSMESTSGIASSGTVPSLQEKCGNKDGKSSMKNNQEIPEDTDCQVTTDDDFLPSPGTSNKVHHCASQ